MRKIHKCDEPQELTFWCRHNPDKHRYEDLTGHERSAIRAQCIAEQGGLCAFCCGRVSGTSSHNAHLLCRDHYPQHSLTYKNIVASCNAPEHCGKFQERKELPLTPMMAECETELKFYITGRVEGLSVRAQQTIEALNLNDPGLKQRRKRAICDLELAPEFHPVEDIPSWDEELLRFIIAEYCKEIEGRLAPYAPVLVNIFRQYLLCPPEPPHVHTS